MLRRGASWSTPEMVVVALLLLFGWLLFMYPGEEGRIRTLCECDKSTSTLVSQTETYFAPFNMLETSLFAG